MINFVTNTSRGIELYVRNVHKVEDATFAPKLVHTSTFTIGSYLADSKVDFDIADAIPFLEAIELNDPDMKMHDLDDESQLIIHYLSNLMHNTSKVYLNVPELDFSDEFVQALYFIVTSFDCDEREITIITSNPKLTSMMVDQNHKPCKDCKPKLYNLKISNLDIISKFIGGKVLILASLFVAMFITSFTINIDNTLSSEYVDFYLAPNNLIVIENTSRTCEFNSVVYNLDTGDCVSTPRISFEELEQFLLEDEVEAVYFDNLYRYEEINKSILNNEPVSVSIPDFGYNLSNIYPDMPCVNPDETPNTVSCEDFNNENSLISVATTNDTSALDQNISSSVLIGPEFIFVQSEEADQLAGDIASEFPSFNTYTNKGVDVYLRKTNSKTIIKLLLLSTTVSLLFSYSLFAIINNLGLSLLGSRYYYDYLTKNPGKVRINYFTSQIIYFGTLIICGPIISANVTNSQTCFYIGLYLGLLTALSWMYLSNHMGTKFRITEHELYSEMKRLKHEIKK